MTIELIGQVRLPQPQLPPLPARKPRSNDGVRLPQMRLQFLVASHGLSYADIHVIPRYVRYSAGRQPGAFLMRRERNLRYIKCYRRMMAPLPPANRKHYPVVAAANLLQYRPARLADIT